MGRDAWAHILGEHNFWARTLKSVVLPKFFIHNKADQVENLIFSCPWWASRFSVCYYGDFYSVVIKYGFWDVNEHAVFNMEKMQMNSLYSWRMEKWVKISFESISDLLYGYFKSCWLSSICKHMHYQKVTRSIEKE